MIRKQPEPEPEMERLIPALDSRLGEYVDAYVLVAISTSGKPIVMHKPGSQTEALALRTLITDYVMGRHQ